MTHAAFGAVIVNYNCARLALDAALSFFGDSGEQAVIVDNASTDDSCAWLDAALLQESSHVIATPPSQIASAPVSQALADGRVTVIRAERNGGFAYGCNLGLKRLRENPALTHFLLLNPDALVAKGTLAAFADRLADPSIGLCGATTIGFEAPHLVQAFGGAALDPLWLVGRNIGEGLRLEEAPSVASVESELAYPLGAAMALRRDYVDATGLLDERYFLYYEEADWAFAGAPTYSVGWAPRALVYHRYGAASKSRRRNAGAPSARSALADYHMTRSRILFAAKWRPRLALLAAVAGGAQAVIRFMRGRRENARAVLEATLSTARRTPRRA